MWTAAPLARLQRQLDAGTAPPIAAAPLVLLYIATGTAEVMGILIAISRNIGHLKERLAEVRDGNLDVQARTDGLDSFGIVMSDFNRMVDGLRQREQKPSAAT